MHTLKLEISISYENILSPGEIGKRRQVFRYLHIIHKNKKLYYYSIFHFLYGEFGTVRRVTDSSLASPFLITFFHVG